MTDQKQILAAYLTEVLAERGLELDPATLDFIHANVQLEARRPHESEEVRSITQTVNSAGKHSATSMKLANLARLDTEKLLGFAWSLLGIAYFDDTASKIIHGTVGLLLSFYPDLKVKFDEQEAQVIFAISQLPSPTFDSAELATTYRQTFPPGLPPERLAASLEVLLDLGVLRQTGPTTYRLQERIKNLSRR